MAKLSKQASALQAVIAQIDSRQFKPIYLLHGDEPYFTNRIANHLVDHVLTPEQKAFNQFLLYGRDITPGQIVDLACRLPLGSDHLLVVVREAQELRNVGPLVDYLNAPVPSTILVLCFGAKMKTGHGKSSPLKQLAERAQSVGLLYESARLRDYEVAPWIDELAHQMGYSIEPQAAQLMAEQLGTDLAAVANELTKLSIGMNPEVKTITSDIVRQAIGLSKDFSVFELTKAIGAGQYAQAMRIAINLGGQREGGEPPMVIASLFGYFNRLMRLGIIHTKYPRAELASRLRVNPYFLNEYMEAMRRYPPQRCARVIRYLRIWDLRTKGVGAHDMPRVEVYKELVTLIMS